ncbi:hypothetical protein HDU96_008139 [Phlyctochytrium bullatum]|nr:hypothetical protein HDU96_008139 [Phlyctochytrium bullatum]
MAPPIIPSQTLYVRSINEKVKKHEVKKCLYHLFSQYGEILDVVALRTEKMRGQAFVAFAEQADATSALRALQGFPFFGKALRIEYGKGISHAVMLREGRILPPKVVQAKLAKAAKRLREDDDDEGEESNKRPALEESKEEGEDDDDMEMEAEEDSDDNPQGEGGENPPYNILFANFLPASVTGTPDMLGLLFKQYPGFKEVRLVPNKSDIAFIEYETVNQAAEAKARLDGFLIAKGHPLKLQFAKR